MKKFIYKITNQLNQKIYIGQTNDIARRFSEHKKCASQDGNKVLYQAIKKYGIENFSFEVIEETANYNAREKYWIQYYNSQVPNGYNMTPGGEEPPIKHGAEHQLAQHTQEEMNMVVTLLLNSELSAREIAEQTNYDATSIHKINLGILWHNNEFNYPLRPSLTKRYKEERAADIIQDLLDSSLTQKEIAEKYGVSRTTVTAINNGQNFKQPNLQYPLRTKIQNQQLKPILMIDIATDKVIQEFNSIIDAARYLGNENKRSAISYCLNTGSKNSTSCGYKWKYK